MYSVFDWFFYDWLLCCVTTAFYSGFLLEKLHWLLLFGPHIKCHLNSDINLLTLSSCVKTAHTRSISSLWDGVPESRKASLYMCVFYMLLKTHRNTPVCFVSSACGVTVSYRLIKAIHHFTQRRLSQQRSSWRTAPTHCVVWNNQHLLIFRFIVSDLSELFIHYASELLPVNCSHTWPSPAVV